MEVGTEISQKIRSAIKAKLIELGAYVDDELPDYIMVMVANKKSQKQMTEDLSLFLGNNTEKFTVWLHGLLKKLQSINSDDAAKHRSKEKHRDHRGDRKKHKTSQGEKTTKMTEGERVRKVSTGEKEKTEKKKNEDRVESATSRAKVVPHTEDEIKISEDTDEFTEENREAELKEQRKVTSTDQPQPAKASKSDKSGDVKKSGNKIPTRDAGSTVGGARSKPVSSSEAKMMEHKEVRKKPSSFVASVKRKYQEIDEDEEYDPANPAVGSVASIVRGPTRKSSVPKALQANKSLLMKAVNEAEKSVTTSKRTELSTEVTEPAMRSDRRPVDLKHRLKTAAGLGLISRSKRSELEGMKYKVDNDQVKTDPKKPRRTSEGFENIRYTIQNEAASRAKTPPKKISPKTKAPPVAPSRVAASAFREMGHQSKVVVKKEPESDEESGEGTDVSSAAGTDVSSAPEDSDSNSSEVGEDSAEEIEIEVTDRAAQTLINMREKNFTLTETNCKAVVTESESQTEGTDFAAGDSSTTKLSKENLQEIDGSLLNMFIDELLPFQFVENEAFKAFAKSLEPKYHFPKRKKLMTEVGILYNTVKAALKKELSSKQPVSFTHNNWTNMEGEWYDTVTVHFITDNWKWRSVMLKTTELSSHVTSESVADHLEETRAKWNLNEPILVTDDSKMEHNLVKLLGWRTSTCFGSCIRAVIRRTLKERDAYHFVETGRKLVREVLGNAAVLEMLEKKKKILLDKDQHDKCLIVDDGQSWNSLLDMMSLLAELTPALHAAVMDSELTSQGVDLRSMLYTFSQHSSVESLVKILSTFRTAVDILTNSDGPTLQKVIPIFIKLDKILEFDNDDNAMMKSIKKDIKCEIKRCLEKDKETCLLACLVHPQTKQMAFVSQREKEEIKSVLFSEIKGMCENDLQDDSGESAKFRKGKKGAQRQTKARSEASEQSDVRKVIVNKGQNKDHGDKENDSESENEQSAPEVDKGGESTDSGQGEEDEKMCTKQNTVTVHMDRDGECKNVARNVQTSSLEGGRLTNLSITVENDWLDDVICASDDQKSPEETAKIELNLYMAEPASNKNPLTWWQDKQLLYPHIAAVARRVLATPASSLRAKDIYHLDRKTDHRYLQIRAEHVDMMLFLKHNRAVLETE